MELLLNNQLCNLMNKNNEMMFIFRMMSFSLFTLSCRISRVNDCRKFIRLNIDKGRISSSSLSIAAVITEGWESGWSLPLTTIIVILVILGVLYYYFWHAVLEDKLNVESRSLVRIRIRLKHTDPAPQHWHFGFTIMNNCFA